MIFYKNAHLLEMQVRIFLFFAREKTQLAIALRGRDKERSCFVLCSWWTAVDFCPGMEKRADAIYPCEVWMYGFCLRVGRLAIQKKNEENGEACSH